MHSKIWHRLEAAYRLLNARWGHKALHILRWVVPLVIVAWLVWSLSRLGWAELWNGRPRSLWFYAVVLAQFYIQPLADLLIYRFLLHAALPLQLMLRKRYVNSMLDYSGEVYFFFWARKKLTLPKGRLLHAVKDTNVLSASASLVMVWATLLAVLLSGSIKLPEAMRSGVWGVLALASLPVMAGIAIVVGGRKITMLSRPETLKTFAIQLSRSCIQLSTDFLVWWLSGALPSAGACLQFVALRLVVTRLPLVPNKDLVFVGIGIAAAGVMDVSGPKVGAVLVAMTASVLVQNLAIVGLPWLMEQFRLRSRISPA